MRRWLWITATASVAVWAGGGCAQEHYITFANGWDVTVDIHVGGDRVLIIPSHAEQGLPYAAAAWTWPRRVDIREHGTGRLLSSFRMSGGDLAGRYWRVDLR